MKCTCRLKDGSGLLRFDKYLVEDDRTRKAWPLTPLDARVQTLDLFDLTVVQMKRLQVECSAAETTASSVL